MSKYDVNEWFQSILNECEFINESLAQVESPSYFDNSFEAKRTLNSISMSLQCIGEILKNIDNVTNHKLFKCYKNIDWKGLIQIRDVISHNYIHINSEIVYWTCKNELSDVKAAINDIQNKWNKYYDFIDKPSIYDFNKDYYKITCKINGVSQLSKIVSARTLDDLNKQKINLKMAAFITFIDELFDNYPKIEDKYQFKYK